MKYREQLFIKNEGRLRDDDPPVEGDPPTENDPETIPPPDKPKP